MTAVEKNPKEPPHDWTDNVNAEKFLYKFLIFPFQVGQHLATNDYGRKI